MVYLAGLLGEGPVEGDLWAAVGQHLGVGPDGSVQGLEQRVALSGVKLKGALPRVTPPPGLEGEAGLV